MAHTIDEDTKKIVKAIVHGDQKRQSRRRAGKHTDFDRKAAEAIKAAKRNCHWKELIQRSGATLSTNYTQACYITRLGNCWGKRIVAAGCSTNTGRSSVI